MNKITLLITTLLFVGCTSTSAANSKKNSKDQAETLGEAKSSYTYIPLDPLAVTWAKAGSCESSSNRLPLVEALPDQTVRMSIKKISVNGNVSFTGFETAAKDDTFEVTYDYGMSDTVSLGLIVAKYLLAKKKYISIKDDSGSDNFVYDYRYFDTQSKESYKETYEKLKVEIDGQSIDETWTKVVVPIYVGLGVRMKANIKINDASADIGGLFSIAAAAASNKISGNLSLQTIGATSEKITATLPVPNEINEATLTNALIAMGSIKVMLHENAVKTSPRVLGFYNPFGGGDEFANVVIQVLASERVKWHWRCEVPIGLDNTDSTSTDPNKK